VSISKRTVDAAEPRAATWFLWDSGKASVAGFGLRISPGGTKAYVLQYRLPGAKSDRRYTIGRHGPWTPDQARERAGHLRRMVDTGTDPFDAEAAEGRAREKDRVAQLERAFDKVAEKWLEAYTVDRKGKARRPASLRIAGTVVRHLKAQFDTKRIDEIGRADITAALDAISPAKVAMRSSVFAYGRILWKWAFERELVESTPFEALRAPAKPESRERVLDATEIPIIWRATRKIPYPFGPAFRLLLITGQRRSEVLGARWEEMDKDGASWTIPGDRTKNKLPHTVPLSDLAMAEIAALAGKPGEPPPDKWPTSGLIFSTNARTPASGVSKAKARLDTAIAEAAKKEIVSANPWRLHDLRRTMATALESDGVNPSTIEAILNHVAGKRSKALGAYARYDYGPEKRAALGAWATTLSALVAPREVATAREAE
jgi:integrase